MLSASLLFRWRVPAISVGPALVILLCLPSAVIAQYPPCPKFPDPPVSVFPSPNILVGSPSGSALIGSYAMTLRHQPLTGPPVPVPNVEAWISGPGAGDSGCGFDAVLLTDGDEHNPDGSETVCGTNCTWWPYLGKFTDSQGSVTFNPRFGGHGELAIEIELPCPCSQGGGFPLYAGYAGVLCNVEARSTDFNADGNTDQDDKLELGEALALPPGSRPSYMDLVVDGVVNAADYRLAATEMQIEISNGIVPLYKCPNLCDPGGPECAHEAVGNETSFVHDTVAPGSTALSYTQSSCQVTLTWTSPGDGAHPSTGAQVGVAKEFDLRYSASPINSGNFAAATPLTGEPLPDIPGTQHTMSVAVANYFAIRTLDWDGNASPITSVYAKPGTVNDLVITQFSMNPRSVTLSWTPPGGVLTYSLRKRLGAPITEANFATSTIISDQIPGSQGQYIVSNGLSGNGFWHFAIRGTDNVGNTSCVSNNDCIKFSPAPAALCNDDGKPMPPSEQTAPTSELAIAVDAPLTNRGHDPIRVDFAVPVDLAGAAYELDVFDVTGKRIAKLASGVAVPGDQRVTWDRSQKSGRRLAAGVYIVRLQVGSEAITQRIVTIH